MSLQSFINLTNTDSSTSLLLEAQLPAAATYKLTMTLTFPSGSYEPCLVHSTCSNCYTPDDCQVTKTNFTMNAFDLRNLTKYGTQLEYQCPIGREFDLDSTTTTKSQNITCLWNSKSWSPGVTFPTCVCKSICLLFEIKNTKVLSLLMMNKGCG